MARKHLSPLNLVNLTSDPGTATEGDFYWNSSTNKLRVYYDGAWADATQAASVYQFSATAPSPANVGDYWIDSTTGSGYVYVSDGDSSQWVDLESNGYIGSSISLTSTAPIALGTAAVGTDSTASRSDHVHPTTGLVTTASLGSGVSTALALAPGVSGSFVTNGGALGTPSSGNLSNATSLPISTGVSGLGTNIATFLATPSSANLLSAVTGETGTSGGLVFATSPTLSYLSLAAGTATAGQAPLKFTSGTNLTNTEAGAVEYTGDIYTMTTSGTATGRGIIPARMLVYSNANSSAATTTTPVAIFQSGARALTLEAAKTYQFKLVMHATATFTSGTATIQFVPTFSQTPVSINYVTKWIPSTAGNSLSTRQTATGAATISPSITATISGLIEIEGTFQSNATTGGTITMNFQMSTTGSSTVINSGAYQRIMKIGTGAPAIISGTWA